MPLYNILPIIQVSSDVLRYKSLPNCECITKTPTISQSLLGFRCYLHNLVSKLKLESYAVVSDHPGHQWPLPAAAATTAICSHPRRRCWLHRSQQLFAAALRFFSCLSISFLEITLLFFFIKDKTRLYPR